MKNILLTLGILILGVTCLAMSQGVRITIDSVAAPAPGAAVAVPVTAANFSSVGSITLKITYDPAVATFVSTSNSPAGVNFTRNAANGVITLIWYDATGSTPLTLTGKLLDLNFTYLTGSSALAFTPSLCEVTDGVGTVINGITYTNGKIAFVQVQNQKPTISAISAITKQEQDTVRIVVSATDPNSGDVLSYTASGTPAGATFDPATRTFLWVPGLGTAGTYTVKFRVSDGQLADSTNAVITITPASSLQLTSPNGGESWQVGSVKQITWLAAQVSTIKIEYTTDNEVSWNVIAASTAASSGTYSWTIPNAASTNCKVRITSLAGQVVSDASDAVFRITPLPTISLTQPNGGEAWQVGSSKQITWQTTQITNIKIEYSTDNGTSWNPVVSTTPASSGSYNWTVPNTISNNCKVRISDASDATFVDVSDNVFQIIPLPTISLTQPNGGEQWPTGSINQITWQSSQVTNIKIEYTTNNGTSWSSVVGSTAASSGSYSWTVPNTVSTNCRVRITSLENSTVKDSSDAVFSIPLGTGVEKNSADVPVTYRLGQNFPNPFNPATTIQFDIPAGAKEQTTLRVYDGVGREVATLMNGTTEAGSYKVKFDASRLASGIYFYRIQSGPFIAVKKLVLMK
ncbi:MAG: T9SS C-terminal target domain-containing protein [Ignavibacteriae bacterium]|nr:MAG: T9SS C-terminal target domain-containing protein [Ignavibacteriota bacterium]